MVSIQVLATPMMGLARSSSVKPMAFSMARAGARSRPWVMVWLWSFIVEITSVRQNKSGAGSAAASVKIVNAPTDKTSGVAVKQTTAGDDTEPGGTRWN